MQFPLDYVRGCFPSLKDSSDVFFDNAFGPQPLATVRPSSAPFSGDAEALLAETRQSLAYFLNANADWAEEEILIASDASELSTRLSRALAKGFAPGGEILTTELDDESGLSSWVDLAGNGTAMRQWPVRKPNGELDTARLPEFLTDRTRVVVMSKASGAVGSIVELLPVALGVQAQSSSLVVNWSSFLPHGAIDVRFLRADFVIASTRSFFGADVGFLWGSRERMRTLRSEAPEMFEGLSIAPNALVGFAEALRYVEELGLLTEHMQLQPSEDYGRRRHMRRGMQAIRHYERTLTALALRRMAAVPGLSVYGISDENLAAHRLPHILFRLEGYEPKELAAALAEHDIHVGHGNREAPWLMRSLGLSEDVGGASISLLHYNQESEIERCADALHSLAPAG